MHLSGTDTALIAAIRSGGQSGADRGALDAARSQGVGIEGWCPAGGWAEDHPEPPGLLSEYPELMETPSVDPAQRTEWNVRDSDATLILAPLSTNGVAASPGTRLTLELAEKYQKPSLLIGEGSTDEIATVLDWLAGQGNGLILNVAGPRESESPRGLPARLRCHHSTAGAQSMRT
ncbi:MAG: putative molybdenum carrier protein [Candidatus Corynebacterium faecigallinarum]|uniref:putative molybdenum carrier protein n=1 Tax=Candidatus Corynebacterium faecigallinarum TaxID=2838528 RepID=UPI003FB6C0BA